ncbi:hypothetical protein I7I50_11984 [Histoplasma capsulatum G186AR]|uniref:Uncharacterized protein n=1 Tax=Ajellomyces capsulatus TaxID=5037 RepID=A0A8H8CS84_AJECA|nr:hypothetical protein I7I52_11678 [Histoplasma capsulatum]QSS70374.1 hypothetical protein I7I50_11984 [Histoplasma capsulatum G186AR]
MVGQSNALFCTHPAKPKVVPKSAQHRFGGVLFRKHSPSYRCGPFFVSVPKKTWVAILYIVDGYMKSYFLPRRKRLPHIISISINQRHYRRSAYSGPAVGINLE